MIGDDDEGYEVVERVDEEEQMKEGRIAGSPRAQAVAVKVSRCLGLFTGARLRRS
jgi:hypothetical protein